MFINLVQIITCNLKQYFLLGIYIVSKKSIAIHINFHLYTNLHTLDFVCQQERLFRFCKNGLFKMANINETLTILVYFIRKQKHQHVPTITEHFQIAKSMLSSKQIISTLSVSSSSGQDCLVLIPFGDLSFHNLVYSFSHIIFIYLLYQVKD